MLLLGFFFTENSSLKDYQLERNILHWPVIHKSKKSNITEIAEIIIDKIQQREILNKVSRSFSTN